MIKPFYSLALTLSTSSLSPDQKSARYLSKRSPAFSDSWGVENCLNQKAGLQLPGRFEEIPPAPRYRHTRLLIIPHDIFLASSFVQSSRTRIGPRKPSRVVPQYSAGFYAETTLTGHRDLSSFVRRLMSLSPLLGFQNSNFAEGKKNTQPERRNTYLRDLQSGSAAGISFPSQRRHRNPAQRRRHRIDSCQKATDC